MSTYTGTGPASAQEGPPPVAPRHGLLTLPGVMKEGDGRWTTGLRVAGYAAHAPSLWEPCSTGTFRVKDDGEEGPTPRFNPVVVYYPITCSTHGMADPQRIARRARDLLEATLSYGVERALADGVMLSSNPFLADTNLTSPNSGAAVSPAVGLGYLENAIGRTGRSGIIHATPAIASRWFEDPQTDFDVLRTGNGTLVAAGGGYIGANPRNALPGPSDETGTIDWAFATGPVIAYVGDLEDSRENKEAVDRSQNVATFRAERPVLVEWDTALQVGVRIDWSLT